jgi:hypothetical protein
MAKKMKKTFQLDKISKPGFTLIADSLEVHEKHLRMHLCDICLGYEPDPEMPDGFTLNQKKVQKIEKKIRKELKKDFDDIDQKYLNELRKELIDMYLCTACGVEFEFKKVKDKR